MCHHTPPPYPSSWTGGLGRLQDQGHGVVLHDQREGYQPPITSKSGSSQVPQGGNDVLQVQCKPHVPLRIPITTPS